MDNSPSLSQNSRSTAYSPSLSMRLTTKTDIKGRMRLPIIYYMLNHNCMATIYELEAFLKYTWFKGASIQAVRASLANTLQELRRKEITYVIVWNRDNHDKPFSIFRSMGYTEHVLPETTSVPHLLDEHLESITPMIHLRYPNLEQSNRLLINAIHPDQITQDLQLPLGGI